MPSAVITFAALLLTMIWGDVLALPDSGPVTDWRAAVITDILTTTHETLYVDDSGVTVGRYYYECHHICLDGDTWVHSNQHPKDWKPFLSVGSDVLVIFSDIYNTGHNGYSMATFIDAHTLEVNDYFYRTHGTSQSFYYARRPESSHRVTRAVRDDGD